MSPLLSTTFGLVFAAWIALEVGLLAREGAGLLAPSDRASALAIIMTVVIAANGALACAALGLGALAGEGVRWTGVGLMAAGLAFRVWAIASLGRFFTAVVRTQGGQGVVRRGPYRVLRHPSYTGTFGTLIGFGLALGTWPGVGLLLVLPLPAYIYRMAVEERALRAALGPAYAAYMRITWRLFPGLW
ncbi:MAG TPA: isoprenylcysteine carboxylmethyltransferase family protein [Chloroflexia bacterium]|nr:isoprenylcysteine carboxylmethyltransferase family protein [Chloroflexia bacterium]